MRCVGLSLALVLALALPACETGGSDGVPQVLIGRWETDSPDYKGRYFEINENRLLFETGEAGLQIHSILGVEGGRGDDGRERWILHYDEQGERWPFRLIVVSNAPTRLQIENRDEVWAPAKEPEMGVDLR